MTHLLAPSPANPGQIKSQLIWSQQHSILGADPEQELLDIGIDICCVPQGMFPRAD